MPVCTMIEAIRQALEFELERDDRVMVLGQDVGQLGGVFRATAGLQDRFGPDRIRDTPLAEAGIAGTALGLAVSGLVPVAELQFLGFAHAAFHQIVDQIARFRYRSRGTYPLQVTIRSPFGGGVRTPEMHSDAVEAHFAHAPGLKVVMPATAYDAKGMLLAAIRDPDPVLFCEPLRGYRLVKDDVPDEDYTVPLGKARIAREGTDVTLIAWSSAVQLCGRAADLAGERGISCQVLDLRSLVPLDVETLAGCVESTGRARNRRRGGADRRLRRRDRRDHPGGGLLLAVGAHRPDLGSRHPISTVRLDRGSLRPQRGGRDERDHQDRGSMSFEFKLPDLGEGMADVEVISWYVAEGDDVTLDQPLLSVETDKLVTDLPSPVAGRVAELRAAPGDKVPVGHTLVLIDAPESSAAVVTSDAERPVTLTRLQKPRHRSPPRLGRPARPGRDARASVPRRQSGSSRSTWASTFPTSPAPDPTAASLATMFSRRRPAPPRTPMVPHNWSLRPQLHHLETDTTGPVHGSPEPGIASETG